MVGKKTGRLKIALFLTFVSILFISGTSRVKAVGPFDGTFLTFLDSWSGINSSTVGSFMNEIAGLQMNTVIIMDLQRSKYNSDCSSNLFEWGPDYQNTMNTIFSKAQSLGIDVYVGLLGHGGTACTTFMADPQKTVTMNFLKDYGNPNNPISYVINHFGTHPNFKGWYITDEPSISHDSNQAGLRDYFKQYAAAIKAVSAKPILISPYMVLVDQPFSPTDDNSPAKLAQRAYDFKVATGIDVQVWQDSVNTYGVALRSDNIGHRYTTRDYYAALSARLGRSGLWADNELGNCCMVPMQGGSYYPASMARINNQLYNASPTFVAKHITWVNQYQMDAVLSGRMQGSERLMKAYGALFGIYPNYQYLKPASYTWVTPPASAYPDTGNTEMFDMVEGEGKNFHNYATWTDPHYSGILGPAELIADMGKEINLAWVGVHTLNRVVASVYFPDSLQVQCSRNGNSYTNLGTFNLPIEKKDSDFVISNTNGHEFNSVCRYLKIRLNNISGAWTFLSEIEIIGKTGSPATPPPPTAAAKIGDVNADGLVNIIDIGIIIDAYGKIPITNIKADVNRDNLINIIDIGMVIDNYGK